MTSSESTVEQAGWLDRSLFGLSAAGIPLVVVALLRLGRAGGLLVEMVCALLFGRAIWFAAAGSPRRLQTVPRVLAYAELGPDAIATITGFWVWVWRPFVASPKRLWRPGSDHADWLERIHAFALVALFAIHTARMAIYVSPSRGRLT